MLIEIKRNVTDEVIFSHDQEDNSLKITLEVAVKDGAYLDGAYLDGAKAHQLIATKPKFKHLSDSDIAKHFHGPIPNLGTAIAFARAVLDEASKAEN